MWKKVVWGGLVAMALGTWSAGPVLANDRCEVDSGYRPYDRYSDQGRYDGGGYYQHGALDYPYDDYYSRSARHRYAHEDLEDRHDRAHARGFYDEEDHYRWHESARRHHDVIHHRIYHRHAPERY